MHIDTSSQSIAHLGFHEHSCNWGTHICGLYENEEERDEIIFGFLQKGDVDGDLGLYCPAERTRDDFFSQYQVRYEDGSNRVHDPKHFQIFNPKTLYYPEGIFSPQAMDSGLTAFYDDSQKNGVRNIRATAEMAWALESIPGIEHLMAYESRLNFFIPGKPWISICLYNLNKFNGATIMQVLQTHPFTISNGVITENPYYQDPKQWLSQNAPEFLSL
jgi:hypothetical protein